MYYNCTMHQCFKVYKISCFLLQYFIGVTMIAMVSELPEIINGIQFALNNNVNLG